MVPMVLGPTWTTTPVSPRAGCCSSTEALPRAEPDSSRCDIYGSMDQPTADEALRRLDPFVGEWTFEAIGADGQKWPGGGRLTFEWHPSGRHLVQHGTAELPEAPENIS